MFAKIKKGFTLAEVLITLVVIGVIAGLTIPALVQQVQKDQYVAGLKKAYSSLTQAYNLLKIDGGGDISYVFPGIDFGATSMNYFANKLNIAKNCGSGMGCLYNTAYYFNGHIATTSWDTDLDGIGGKAVLADGSILIINDTKNINGPCITPIPGVTGPLENSVCGQIIIDINGAKRPNVGGRDVFGFWITKTGIYPTGIYDNYTCDPVLGLNNGCTAKVLREGAMNY